MEYAQALIDKVCQIRVCTRYKICQDLGVSQSFLSKVYLGKKPMPPELAAELANLVGDDPAAAALEALAASQADESRRARLRSWFHLPAGATAAALLAVGLSGSPAPAQASQPTAAGLHIMSNT